MKVIKRKYVFIIIVVLFIAGLAVLLYPKVAQWYSSRQQDRAIMKYFDSVSQLGEENISERFENAMKYNLMLSDYGYRNDNEFSRNDYSNYSNALSVTGDQIMCVVEIPKIDVRLPVYSGTDDRDLQRGAGHIEGTSLPIGGLGTHCAISAHRGLPNAVMFRDLDLLERGDEFYIYTLGRKMTYRVDNISVVLPDDISGLAIDGDKDYLTLVTCTPYAINSHRLLVRGVAVQGED